MRDNLLDNDGLPLPPIHRRGARAISLPLHMCRVPYRSARHLSSRQKVHQEAKPCVTASGEGRVSEEELREPMAVQQALDEALETS